MKKAALLQSNFSELTGQSQIGLDYLSSMIQNSFYVTILTRGSPELPEEFYSSTLKFRWRWKKLLQLRRKKPLTTRKTIKNFALFWIALMYNKVTLLLERETYNYVFVHGLASHFLHPGEKTLQAEFSILILQEMPEYVLNSSENDNWHDKLLEEILQYDKYIFVSEKTRNEWNKFIFDLDNRSYILYNTTVENSLENLFKTDKSDAKEKVGFTQNSFNAVMVGTVNYRKGYDIVVHELPRIIDKIPNFQVHILGKINAGQKAFIQEIAASKGVQEYVHFLGSKNNAEEYIYAADVLLHPARSEAHPRVILEAMALKTPIIASKVGGIPESIRDGEDGFLFDIEQSDRMVDAVYKIYQDENLRIRLTENAETRYWQNFSRKKFNENFTKILHNLEESDLNNKNG